MLLNRHLHVEVVSAARCADVAVVAREGQHECCGPGSILLCMGLFSRFCVQALVHRRGGALHRARDMGSSLLSLRGIDSIQPISRPLALAIAAHRH